MIDPSTCSELPCDVAPAAPATPQPVDDTVPVPRRRRLDPEERERILHGAARHDARSRLARKAVALAVVAGLAWLAWWRVTAYFAEQRVRELLLAAARGKGVPAVVEELSGKLPLVVEHCNAFLQEQRPLKERSALVTGLETVVRRLPRDVELAPLLDLTPKAGAAHRSARQLVRERADRPWLLAHTCRGSDAARAFAVEALRPAFPLARLADDQAAKLAQRTSLDAKQKLFDQTYDAVHRQLEAELTGRYRIHIDAAWKIPGGPATPHQAATAAPPIRVTCERRTWHVEMAGAQWSGTVDDLPRLKLTSRLQPLFSFKMLRAPLRALWSSEATLTFDGQLRASIGPVPRYADATRGWTPLDRRSRVPHGAVLVGTQIRAPGGFPKPGITWLLPPRAGFDKLHITVVKAR